MDSNASGYEHWRLRGVFCAGLVLFSSHGCQSTDPSLPPTIVSRAQPLVADDRSAPLLVQGQIIATINYCPHVALEATPLSAFVHGGIRVLSQSVDPEGDATTLVWSAEPDGAFVNPAWRMTEYRCASAGTKTIFLQVRDAPGCRSTGQVSVTCVAARL